MVNIFFVNERIIVIRLFPLFSSFGLFIFQPYNHYFRFCLATCLFISIRCYVYCFAPMESLSLLDNKRLKPILQSVKLMMTSSQQKLQHCCPVIFVLYSTILKKHIPETFTLNSVRLKILCCGYGSYILYTILYILYYTILWHYCLYQLGKYVITSG